MDFESVIKVNREWKEHIHFGYWCVCFDEEIGNIKKRIVLKMSKSSGELYYSGNPSYLVDPKGNRVDN